MSQGGSVKYLMIVKYPGQALPSKNPMRKRRPYTCWALVAFDRQQVRIPHINYVHHNVRDKWQNSNCGEILDTSHAGNHFSGPMCETMAHDGYSMMMYPMLRWSMLANHDYGMVKSNRSRGILEESGEVVVLVSVQLQVLLHTRDVGVALG